MGLQACPCFLQQMELELSSLKFLAETAVFHQPSYLLLAPMLALEVYPRFMPLDPLQAT